MPTPATETARLKAEIDLPGYIRGRGIALSPVGRSLVGLCPFHEDTRPSLSVTPERGLFHCFACGTGGDVIRFVERLDQVSFPEAVRILTAHTGHAAGGPSLSQSRPTTPGHKPHTSPAMNPEQTDPLLDPPVQQVLRYAIDYYAKTLERTPEAIRYLEARGLVHPELISTFRVGYSDGSLLEAIPAYPSKEGLHLREQLAACGILRHTDNAYREHMRGRIVVPFIDEQGVIRQLYGRRIATGGAYPDHLYLPLAKNCVFNPRAFIADTLIVCEGPLDALSFFCAGLPNVTCTTSAGDIPQAFLEAIDKGNTLRVLIAFDSDEAGDRGTDRLVAALEDAGVVSTRMRFPSAKRHP